ncbi:MAG: LysM peptidoglycan-binding domain-containing protein [Gorillibacterium sp.]|nr:LysM peptidoglycan-binding domain-containing protein [Gorillibacterium sp.]
MQTFYTVRPGDTLSAIAKRWEVPLPAILAANQAAPPYSIYPGQQISVPSIVVTVQVKPGDSLYSLAQAYGIPLSVIIEANQLRPPYTIYAGQLLLVPPGVTYYVVQPGDTLYSLAGRYNVGTAGVRKPELIRLANRLPNDAIYAGMRIIIPYAPPGGVGAIAYTASCGGAFNLWLYDPTSGQNRAIGGQQAAEHSVPYWSPDNRRIAFIGSQGVLFVLDVLLGTNLRIDQIKPYTTLTWSPDSRRLGYTKPNGIVLYDLQTFSSTTMPLPGARQVQWFPSGDKLLFTAQDNTGVEQLYEIRTNGTEHRQITRNREGAMNNMELSPNGAYALFTSPGASISIIYVVELASGNINSLTGSTQAKNYHPKWSPDSTSIGFSATEYSDRRGYFSTIRTERRQGGNQQVLSVSDCFSTPVSWSPAGEAIAYLSGCTDQGQTNELWVVHLRHPAPVRAIAGAGAITALQWSRGAIPRLGTAFFSSAAYKVAFPYPSDWRRVNETRYEGVAGFFQISAISSDQPLQELCRTEAYHRLMPYGSSPRIVPARVQGREACYIFPSADQSPELRGQAALIAEYPEPVAINGTTYNYFILWATQPYIQMMVNGLRFL